MSEDQLKAANAEAADQEEVAVELISDDDLLEGVAGGGRILASPAAAASANPLAVEPLSGDQRLT